jgi:hypothetical protein
MKPSRTIETSPEMSVEGRCESEPNGDTTKRIASEVVRQTVTAECIAHYDRSAAHLRVQSPNDILRSAGDQVEASDRIWEKWKGL